MKVDKALDEAPQTSLVPTARILFVTVANHRFRNMAVNQRLTALTELGSVEVRSVYPDSFPPDIASEADIRSFPVSRRLPKGFLRLPIFTVEITLWSLWRLLVGTRFDIVYALQDTSAIAGLFLTKRKGGWVIDAVDDPALELRNAVEKGKRAKALLLAVRDRVFRSLIQRADLVFTIGSSRQDLLPLALEQRYGVSADRVLPIPQAIDVESQRPASPAHPNNRPRVFYVGWVSPIRGVDTLVQAVRLLREQGVGVELRLAGYLKADDRLWLDTILQRHADFVHYLGELPSERTLEEMVVATVCVCPFPDRPELAPVQPVKVLEYMALGKPIVATRLAGNSALLDDGVSGLLTTPGDATEMATALRRVVQDGELARRLGIAARDRVHEFDVGRVNDRIKDALSKWL